MIRSAIVSFMSPGRGSASSRRHASSSAADIASGARSTKQKEDRRHFRWPSPLEDEAAGFILAQRH
jgi:hypothetical protein